MNNMWGMVRKNYVMHLIMAILCMLVSFVGSEWVGFAMGLAIYVVYVMMQYGDGVDRGERACTLSATVDKIQSEGKTVEDRMLRQRFDPKGAVKAFVISSVPLALIAIANLVLSDPDSVTESTFGIIT